MNARSMQLRGTKLRRLGALPIAIVVLFAPSPVAAGWWTHEDKEPGTAHESRVGFAEHANFWAGTFRRPDRACRRGRVASRPPIDFPNAAPDGGAGAKIAPGAFVDESNLGCWNESSDEIGIGGSLEVLFRVTGPFHLSASAGLFYTFPNRDYVIKNQVVLPIELGILMTWPEWALRPIVSAKITPLLYLTDDARDYALGGEMGLAYRFLKTADLMLTVGLHVADTVTAAEVRFGGAFL